MTKKTSISTEKRRTALEVSTPWRVRPRIFEKGREKKRTTIFKRGWGPKGPVHRRRQELPNPGGRGKVSLDLTADVRTTGG